LEGDLLLDKADGEEKRPCTLITTKRRKKRKIVDGWRTTSKGNQLPPTPFPKGSSDSTIEGKENGAVLEGEEGRVRSSHILREADSFSLGRGLAEKGKRKAEHRSLRGKIPLRENATSW